MVDVEFHLMTRSDAEFYRRLMDMVGWGLTIEDLDRMLHYEPEGCFIANMEGHDVGMVASYLYGEFGWIGNLITIPDVRGRGVGVALMRKAVDRLNDEGAASIRLDAVAKAIPLYRRLGFRPEYQSLRFRGPSHQHPISSASQMNADDLEDVEMLDQRFFGANRGKMLRRVLQDFPDLCFVSRVGGRIIGYIMAKRGEEVYRIGPWICEPEHSEAASSLLRAVMNRASGEDIWVGVPEENEASVEMLKANGLAQLPPSLRMCHGICRRVDDVSGIFGIGAAEKG